MYDAGKIVAGLLIFLVLLTFPVWYNAATGRGSYVPELKIATTATACVARTAYMRVAHMHLLNQWRDEAVRGADREYHAFDGAVYRKSLSNTCLNCHGNKAEFCDRCHNYAAVSQPDCWNCHLVPEEVGR